MPTRMDLGNEHSGVDVTWTPSARRLDIGGFYDGFVGIRGESMLLEEFFRRLGITQRHCDAAFRRMEKE